MAAVMRKGSIPVPWGRIHLKSLGPQSGFPILLVHGGKDNEATIMPLLELLQDTYNIIVLDMPGTGKSDPFPKDLHGKWLHFVKAIHVVVKSLKWESFVYIGRSIECKQGLLYNTIYPDRIKKIIYLDSDPSLQDFHDLNIAEFYKKYASEKYSNFMDNTGPVGNKEGAVARIMRVRELNEKQDEIILNLIKTGADQYRLSWDQPHKISAPQNGPKAKKANENEAPKNFYFQFGQTEADLNVNYIDISVEGPYDVVVSNPDGFVNVMRTFMETDYVPKPKL